MLHDVIEDQWFCTDLWLYVENGWVKVLLLYILLCLTYYAMIYLLLFLCFVCFFYCCCLWWRRNLCVHHFHTRPFDWQHVRWPSVTMSKLSFQNMLTSRGLVCLKNGEKYWWNVRFFGICLAYGVEQGYGSLPKRLWKWLQRLHFPRMTM